MARVILGVTGSVAAIRTPELFAAIRAQEHLVRVVATEPALYFFDAGQLASRRWKPTDEEPADPVFRDRDEWPGLRYRRGDPVLHIEFRNWADLLIIAPLDANTLAKLAIGPLRQLPDLSLPCLGFFQTGHPGPGHEYADVEKPAHRSPPRPTASRSRWHHGTAARWSLETAPEHFALHAPNLILIPPQSKRLACGDVGLGAMAEVATIAEVVRAWSELETPDD